MKAVIVHKSVSKGDIKTVKELVEQGADVNAPDKNNCTPVYPAFCENNEEMIEYLVSKGADQTIPPLDYDQNTLALDLAREWVKRGIPKFREVADLIETILNKVK